MQLARIWDVWQVAQTITPRRAWNALKILASYHVSRLSKRNQHVGLPISISIEPTTACNLRCPECPSGLRSFTRPTGNLKTDFFRKMIDQMAPHSIYLILYFQGEPYINPEFLKMVEYAKQKKLYTITSTNAHFLTDKNAEATVRSGLSRLIISIDGTTQQTYQSYRKEGNLSQVIAGTKNIVKWKKAMGSKTPHLVFQFLVVKPNEHQIPEVYKLAKELGVDEVKLKTAQIYDYKNGHPLIPSQDKYTRYRKMNNGLYSLKHKLQNQCWKMWHSAVITWDGRVVPCCFDKDASHQMGDLQQQTFREIWRSREYRGFRTSILQDRKNINICTNCTEGCSVWA